MKYAALIGAVLLIIIIMVVLIVRNNAKVASAQQAYTTATAQQGELAGWWAQNSPFSNTSGLPWQGLPSQAECDKANATGGFCISTGSILSMFGVS